MEKLTKVQKMDMVSKAIDAGFDVELMCHNVKSDSELDSKLAVFGGSLDRNFNGSNDDHVFARIELNGETKYEDKFSATIIIDSLRGAL